MHPTLQELCNALDKVSTVVRSQNSDKRRVTEIWGQWNVAPLTPIQIANIPKRLSEALKARNIEELEEHEVEEIVNLTTSVEGLHPTIIPYLFNGNIASALPPFMDTMSYASDILGPLLGWRIITDRRAFPAALASRLEKTQAKVESLTGGITELESKLETINAAHDAAEELPTTLETLKRANVVVAAISDEAIQNRGRIKDNHAEGQALLESLHERSKQADKLVSNCEEAYRITTSKGLAGAFNERAESLNSSMRLWVTGLVAALIVGSFFGYVRVQLVMESLNAPEIVWTSVWAKIALAALSIAAPVWFAWLATKQIGQRFRLAEDYAFKASVSKAYEGYRREAADIDPSFAARLFASALTRLEEAPLRLVETESHSSPLHELARSEGVQSTIRSGMELAGRVLPGGKGQAKGNGASPQTTEAAD